jgi:hypothetical protein
VKATIPEAICTWTSTGLASTPSKATVDTRDTILRPHLGPARMEHLQNNCPSARGNKGELEFCERPSLTGRNPLAQPASDRRDQKHGSGLQILFCICAREK